MLVVAEIAKKRKENVVREIHIGIKRITLLKDLQIRKILQENVFKLADIEIPNLWECLIYGVLEGCDGVCVKIRRARSEGDTLWWSGEATEAITRMKGHLK